MNSQEPKVNIDEIVKRVIEECDKRYAMAFKRKHRDNDETSNPIKKRLVTRTAKDLDLPENQCFLLVPYEEKDEVRKMGAYWSSEHKLWYIPSRFITPEEREAFSKYRQYVKEVDPVTGETMCVFEK